MTLREVALVLDGEGARQTEWQALAAWVAWHAAALPRAKRFPKLADLMPSHQRGPGRRQSPEQLLKIVKLMNAEYGGDEVCNKEN